MCQNRHERHNDWVIAHKVQIACTMWQCAEECPSNSLRLIQGPKSRPKEPYHQGRGTPIQSEGVVVTGTCAVCKAILQIDVTQYYTSCVDVVPLVDISLIYYQGPEHADLK